MFKLYGKDEKVELFKVRYKLRFISESDKYAPTIKANVFYEVKRTQQIPYTFSLILPPADGTLIKLDDIGLYPERRNSVYQLIIGFGGSSDILIYPMIPETDYFLRLEKAEYAPNPAVESLRYLGCLTKEDSPIQDPKLEIITVKDYETVAFNIFNPTSVYKKLIVDILVNRCLIEEVPKEEKVNIWRDILDYRLLRW